MSHRTLIKNASLAIEELFSDQSVSADTTYSDLSDLRADIDIKMECIREDKKRKEKKS